MEDLCSRCGRCCELKRPVRVGGGRVIWILEGKNCPNLTKDEQGRPTCLHYGTHAGRTFLDGYQCSSAEEMAKRRLLPPECPYSRRIQGYKSVVGGYNIRVVKGKEENRAAHR